MMEMKCCDVTDDLDDDDTTDPFYENLESSNGKVIVFIARAVGFLVAFAAMMFLGKLQSYKSFLMIRCDVPCCCTVLILVFLRATLAMFIFKWGSIATIMFSILIINCSLKYGSIPMKNFLNLLLRACH